MILEQYVFFFLVFAISAYFLYTRIRYPFWSHMPVSHTYDVVQFSDGIIQSIPKRNKFTNQNQIKTASFFELTEDQQKATTHIFNCFYVPSDVIFSTISPEILKTRLSGHIGTPFVSADPSFGIGCTISYPVNIIQGTNEQGTNEHSTHNRTAANYLAYLATDRNQNITRALISTHDFNVRTMNPQVNSTLYKKHVGKCAGAKPLIEFKTSVFYINVEVTNQAVSNAHLIQIYKSNWYLIQDYYEKLPSMFDFVAILDIGALSARVDANQLFIYAYRIGTQIMALYFIEDMNTLYENVADYGGKTLSLVASVNNILEPDGTAVFYNGFVEALQKISKQNKDYKMMVIDDVGHNAQIVEQTKRVKPAIFETEGGYYWINHRVDKPFQKVLMIL
jgi:hypothetical protein